MTRGGSSERYINSKSIRHTRLAQSVEKTGTLRFPTEADDARDQGTREVGPQPVELFQRRPRSIEITEMAERAYQYCQGQEVGGRLTQSVSGVLGRLRVPVQ